MSRTADDISAIDRKLMEADTHVTDLNGTCELHTDGAAVRDQHVDVHVAVNLFHFRGGPCAELVALGDARAAGARTPRTILTVGGTGRDALSPCGPDRQLFGDHHLDLQGIVSTENGRE